MVYADVKHHVYFLLTYAASRDPVWPSGKVLGW